MAKKKENWIQPLFESAKRRGTAGTCTGSKYGGPTCPPGSKRYTTATTLRKIAAKKKK